MHKEELLSLSRPFVAHLSYMFALSFLPHGLPRVVNMGGLGGMQKHIEVLYLFGTPAGHMKNSRFKLASTVDSELIHDTWMQATV